MDVTLLRWPEEDLQRKVLSQSGDPRLLLVSEGNEPPVIVDCLEDWIRLPAADHELRVRVENLAARSLALRQPTPSLDGHGVLRFEGRWAALPPLEARLTEGLLSRYGAVASRESLIRAGWPNGAPGRNALDVHVLRLRRRLDPLALAIRTVRSRGYLLESDGNKTAPASNNVADFNNSAESNGSGAIHPHLRSSTSPASR